MFYFNAALPNMSSLNLFSFLVLSFPNILICPVFKKYGVSLCQITSDFKSSGLKDFFRQTGFGLFSGLVIKNLRVECQTNQ